MSRKVLEPYIEIARNLIVRDDEKNAVAREMDKMYQNEWTRTGKLADLDWLVDRVDPGPHNAVKAGMSAFATMTPAVSVVRPGNTYEDKQRFNKIENLLKYHFMKASKRRGSSLVAEILKSAMLYSEVAAQVIHVDAQLSLLGDISANKRRAIKAQGDFVVNLHNPKNVHVRRSDLTIDGVLLKKKQSLAEFVAFWGEMAKPILKQQTQKGNEDKMHVISYDWTTHDERVVWANLVEESIDDFDAEGVLIMREEHDIPFLPWISWVDSSQLEDDEKYKRMPLNYAVYKTGVWNAINSAETMQFGESVTYAAAPRWAIEGPTDNVDIEYNEPGNVAHVLPGHKLVPLQPPGMDENLLALADRARRDLDESTAPQIVITGDVPSGTAFATYNQAYQSGLQTYAPYRNLGNRACEDIMKHMLFWAKYLDKPLKGGGDPEKTGELAFDGAPFTIDVDTYGYDIDLMVNLQPDLPIDRLAQLQAAATAVRELNYSPARALEQVGEHAPEEVFDEAAQFSLRQTKLAGQIQQIQAEDALKAQATMAGLQSLVQLAQDPMIGQFLQQLAQNPELLLQMAQGGQGGGGGVSEQGLGGGIPGVGGPGFDPAQGGTPPANAAPGAGQQDSITGELT